MAITVDPQRGRLVVTGNSYNGEISDTTTIAYNLQGTALWLNQYPGTRNDGGKDVARRRRLRCRVRRRRDRGQRLRRGHCHAGLCRRWDALVDERLRRPQRQGRSRHGRGGRREEPLGREIVAGWRYILRRPGLVAMVVFFVVFNFLFSLPQALITPLVLTTAGPATLGLVAGSAGIGILVGNVVMSVWGGTVRRATGMVGATVLTGAASVIAGLGRSPWLLAASMFGLFCSLMIINAHWLALIQTKVGLELQGRVLATNQMLATSTLPLGFLVAGPLVSLASLGAVGQATAIQFVLLGTGVALAVWGVAGLRYRRLRYLEDDLPDAVPDAEVGSRDDEQAAADRLLVLAP